MWWHPKRENARSGDKQRAIVARYPASKKETGQSFVLSLSSKSPVAGLARSGILEWTLHAGHDARSGAVCFDESRL